VKTFVIIGSSGYIAPKHLSAISSLGHNLLAAIDISDSAGILDSYFPYCAFFLSIEEFDQWLKLQSNVVVDFVSICSPNYLHYEHISYALSIGSSVICEKPLVLNNEQLLALEQLIASSSKHRVNCILQMRLHREYRRLIDYLKNKPLPQQPIELNYIAPRGAWYLKSWKSQLDLSGGILMNIGVHLFDLLIQAFGKVLDYKINELSMTKAKGVLHFNDQSVVWYLSILRSDLPKDKQKGVRQLRIADELFDFSGGFEDIF